MHTDMQKVVPLNTLGFDMQLDDPLDFYATDHAACWYDSRL